MLHSTQIVTDLGNASNGSNRDNVQFRTDLGNSSNNPLTPLPFLTH